MSADGSRLRADLERWAYEVFDTATAAMPDLIRPRAPIGKSVPGSSRVPGELRASINRSAAPSPGAVMRAVVEAPVPQARYTDKGTDPHEIWPRGGQVRRQGGYPLVFYWPQAGGVVKSYGWHGQPMGMVEHPGNAAMPWWDDAVRDAFERSLKDAAASIPL